MNSETSSTKNGVLLAGVALAASTLFFTRAGAHRTTTPMDDVLAELAAQSSFSIVQVGAYIGDTDNDPLFDFLTEHLHSKSVAEGRDAKVVLIEPIGEYFEQLRENYKGTTCIAFEKVAIADSDNPLEMYRLNADPVEAGFPEWLSQLSSLKKERMEQLWDSYERMEEAQQWYLEHRVVESVDCMTLDQLLAKHNLQSLDLLQVDAEGYDYEVLKTLSFDKVKPRFINFERVLLNEQEAECRAMLESLGYTLFDWGQDTLCILQD